MISNHLFKNIAIYTGFLIAESLQAQNATEIVKRADDKMRGENSGISEMSMKIIRPTWERTIEFKSWSKGTENAMVLITAPAREKGQSFLKLGREMWNWNPTISRTIKLPPSMLSQGWMGSDFTNDDMINQRSILVDYSHEIIDKEKIEGRECHVIELIPKEDAPVVWGKIIFWISKTDYMVLKSEYFDEDEYLVKTELGKEIKNMNGRIIPTVYEIIPAEEEGQKTVVTLNSIAFNVPISDEFFSIQNMKRLR
ncbi:MAG: outer membrane lipoprotein-sorting protein [Bacteroidetes bacterium RBG_13_42_15]|nr:MAG: outer membrane lipoprotein-sorting protein [Bacteroidetes bacterium RBG_13_42_15]HJX71104.1 outer membrane lipoprotein-sorting protein [Bacteroidales bacterium]